VKLGGHSFITSSTATPAELAQALEASGFESFLVPEHTHIPIDPDTGVTMVDTRTGAELPDAYSGLYDPFVALGHAAAVTSRIKLGTGIYLINEHDTIHTAKEVATLDNLSGGRVILGIGAGWNAAEMANHGFDATKRFPGMREKVEAITAIWTNDIAEYHGEIVDFGPMRCDPKPIQRPRPPIYVGGNYKNIPRIVDYADGWIPSTTVAPSSAFLTNVAELNRQAKEAGRDPIPVTAIYVSAVEGFHVDHMPFADETWDEWEAAGIERTVLMLPPQRDQSLRMIEAYAHLAERSH
jgi:probable F420-dependent oxidoreductase